MKKLAAIIGLTVVLAGCEASKRGEFGGNDDAPLRTLTGHTQSVRDVAFDPSGTRLASGGADGTIRFWDVESGQCLRTLDGHAEWVHTIAYSPDGRHLASGGRDSLVKVWDADTGELLKTLVGHSGTVFSVSYSPDGQSLVSLGGGGIKIWDAESGECLRMLAPTTFFTPKMACFTPDGDQIVSASDTLQWLDAETGESLRTFEGHSDSVGEIVFSGDGKWLASRGSYTDRSLRLWDAASGDTLWSEEFGDGDGPWALEFSADDGLLASGHFDGTIRNWDVETGRLIRTFKAHSSYVSALAADAQEKYLASGSDDGSIRLWAAPKLTQRAR